jgi:hypothetical protein
MIKALAIKELRESAGLAALAVLGMAWVVMKCMGRDPLQIFFGSFMTTNHLAFVTGDGFYDWAAIAIGAFAILLGLKQSAWELQHGTYYYLLHRPMSLRLMFAVKLAVGASLVVAVLSAAILIYGAWAAMPGHLSAPFEWSMTLDSWILAAALPLVYLGAFLSGIRPGRWFGTRLAPLAGAIFLVLFVCILPFWWLQLPVLLLGYVSWLAAIDYYSQTRDY